MAQPRLRPARESAQGVPRPVSSFYGGGGGQSGGSGAGVNRDSYISTANRSSMFTVNNDARYSPNGFERPPVYGGGVGQQRNSYYSQCSQMQDDYATGQYSPYSQQASPSANEPDIYGDFNNMAPKVASRLSSYDKSPTAADTQTTLLEKGNRMSMAGGELIPTPDLGKDWNTDESRRSKIIEKPKSGSGLYKGWWKGFKKALKWRYIIFVIVGLLGCIAALLFFVIPRQPTFELSVDAPLTSDNRNTTFTRIPAVFSWNAQLNVAIDGKSNWIPYHFSAFDVNLYDLNTGKKVAEGGITGGRKTFPGREVTPTSLDLSFYYRGNNASDTTWKDFYNACSHKYTGVKRPGLDFTVEIKMDVRGLIGTKTAGTTITGLECPIELPAENA